MSQPLAILTEEFAFLVDSAEWKTEHSVEVGKNGAIWTGRPCEVEWSIRPRPHCNGYVEAWPGVKYGARIYLHRLLLNAPRSLTVDHINGDGLDNRLSNLRLATQQQNCHNTRKRNGRATSQFMGVSFAAAKNRWRAVGCEGRKVIHLGYFRTEEQAAIARNAWVETNRPVFGHLASLPSAGGRR